MVILVNDYYLIRNDNNNSNKNNNNKNRKMLTQHTWCQKECSFMYYNVNKLLVIYFKIIPLKVNITIQFTIYAHILIEFYQINSDNSTN